MTTELLTLLGWLVLATLAHEGAHFVLLRRAGAEPKFCWHGIGFGWRFDAAGVGSEKLIAQWLAGPISEGLLWLLGAAILPHLFGACLIVGGFQVAGNLLLPGSDGRRAWRWAHDPTHANGACPVPSQSQPSA